MIKKETLDFLKKIRNNNNRDWFEKNKPKYLAAKENVEQFIDEVITGLRTFDKRLSSDLTAKKCVFRIYRDTRFSKDKRPYKTNLGASINPGGKMAEMPGYYIHIEPGASFVAGGMWMPPSPELAKIRQEIDYNQQEFLKILKDKNFRKHFGTLSQEDKLTTSPKGYAKDHPLIDHLRLKSYIVVGDIKEKDLLSKNLAKTIVTMCKAMKPLNDFLQRAID